MSLSVKLTNRLYYIVYGTIRLSPEIEPILTVSNDMINFETPSSKKLRHYFGKGIYDVDVVYQDTMLLLMSTRLKSLREQLEKQFLGKKYKGENGCYISPYGNMIISRIDEGTEYVTDKDLGTTSHLGTYIKVPVNNYHYIISFPFIHTSDCSTYFDILPSEINYMIMLRGYVNYDILMDILEGVVGSYIFTPEKYFKDTFPELYSQIKLYGFDTKISKIPDGWKKVYTYVRAWSDPDMVRLYENIYPGYPNTYTIGIRTPDGEHTSTFNIDMILRDTNNAILWGVM